MFYSLFPNLSIQPDGQIVPNAPVRDKNTGRGLARASPFVLSISSEFAKKIIDNLLAKIYGRSGARIESFQNSSSGWERGDSSEGALDQKNSSRTSFALRTVTLFLYCCILFFCTIVYYHFCPADYLCFSSAAKGRPPVPNRLFF